LDEGTEDDDGQRGYCPFFLSCYPVAADRFGDFESVHIVVPGVKMKKKGHHPHLRTFFLIVAAYFSGQLRRLCPTIQST